MRSALRGGVAKGGVQPPFDHAPRERRAASNRSPWPR